MPILREIIAIKAAFDYSAGPTGEVVYVCLGIEALDLVTELVTAPLPGALGQQTNGGVIRPQRFAIEPLTSDTKVLPDGTPEWVKVTASHAPDFLDVSWPNQIPRPEYASGTTLKLETKFCVWETSMILRFEFLPTNQVAKLTPAHVLFPWPGGHKTRIRLRDSFSRAL